MNAFVVHRLRAKPVEYTVTITHFVRDGQWVMSVGVNDVGEDRENKLRVAADLRTAACGYCGTCLTHNFIIASADDRRFVVGCDCVAKTGDAGLAKEVKRARVEVALAKRTAARDLKKAEREALWALERAERAKAFVAEHAALIERAQAFYEVSDFIRDVTEKGVAGRFISDRAFEALTRAVTGLEEAARRRAASRHIGTVGKRETFEVTVDRVASFERQSFSGFGRETVWIVTMVDANGNSLVSKTPNFSAQKGERLVIKATVKAHDEYRGERQTIVQRVKVEKTLDTPAKAA